MSGILAVCDANVCRSVAIELLLESAFARHTSLADITVASRGATALSGRPTCPVVAEMQDDEPWRAHAARHRSVALDGESIEAADLILTATRSSRSAVVSLVPAARRRVFTLREALWVAGEDRHDRGASGNELVRNFAAHLDDRRGLHPAPEPRALPWRRASHPFDIEDGHTGSRRAHASTLRQVEGSVAAFVQILVQDPSLTFLSTRKQSIE